MHGAIDTKEDMEYSSDDIIEQCKQEYSTFALCVHESRQKGADEDLVCGKAKQDLSGKRVLETGVTSLFSFSSTAPTSCRSAPLLTVLCLLAMSYPCDPVCATRFVQQINRINATCGKHYETYTKCGNENPKQLEKCNGQFQLVTQF